MVETVQGSNIFKGNTCTLYIYIFALCGGTFVVCLTALTSDTCRRFYETVSERAATLSLQLPLTHPVNDHVINRGVFVLLF